MAIPDYGVLVGRVSDRQLATPKKNHYEVRVEAAGASYRIAVNVQSQDKSEVLYRVVDDFQHPMTAQLAALADGRHPLPSTPGGLALDFTREHLVARAEMEALPLSAPGTDNDLNDKIDKYVTNAMTSAAPRIYAFGSYFIDPGKRDPYFGFNPGQGIHDVHFNQGNSGAFKKDNGVFQDGALLFHFPDQNRWSAIFLAFQTQSWQTDAQGNPTTVVQPDDDGPIAVPPPAPGAERLRIVAIMANAKGDPEIESVTLINASPDDVSLDGWALSDRNQNKFPLKGKLAAGNASRITIAKPMELSNKGGAVSLLDPAGKIVDGVSYTKAQASQEGWTIVF